jgi:hypothetical protein
MRSGGAYSSPVGQPTKPREKILAIRQEYPNDLVEIRSKFLAPFPLEKGSIAVLKKKRESGPSIRVSQDLVKPDHGEP